MMGREIRRVPPNWEHPRHESGHRWAGEYRACYDSDYKTAADKWVNDFDLYRTGQHPEQSHLTEYYQYYWEYDSPPDEDSYRPAFTSEPTWYQVYETVSEGTPVTPPFATQQELIDYLVERGDFWDQKRGHGGWTRKAAEQFVGIGFAPSMLVTGGHIYMARDGFPKDGE